MSSAPPLFDHFGVVRVSDDNGLDADNHLISSKSNNKTKSNDLSIYIAYKLSAPNVEPFPPVVTQFCYPDADVLEKSSKTDYVGESFTFTLTEASGARVFGFSRRFLPVASRSRYPECICLLSKHPFFGFFHELLEYVLVRWIVHPGAVFPLLLSALELGVPSPGELYRVRVLSDDGKFAEHCILERNHPTYSPVSKLSPLFRRLSVDNILLLLSALLCEQRIVLCANSLSTLSECIHASLAMLYPLEWPHIFIPLLPKSLLNYTCAPMPFVVGVREAHLDDLLCLPLEDVVIVYLDSNKMEVTQGNEKRGDSTTGFSFPLPHELTVKLKKHLKANRTSDQELYCGFLAFFLNLFVHCKWDMLDKKNKFDIRKFLEHTLEVQPDLMEFMQAISGSQMVEQYFAKNVSINRGTVSEGTYPSIEEFEKWRLSLLSSKQEGTFSGCIKKLHASMEAAKSEHLFKASANQVKKSAMELTSNQQTKRNSKEILSELRDATCDSRNFYTVLEVIITRFKDAKGTNWRHGHKGIALFEHLLRFGSDRVVFYAWQPTMIKYITEFTGYSHKESFVQDTVQKAAQRVLNILTSVFALRACRTYPKLDNILKYRTQDCDKNALELAKLYPRINFPVQIFMLEEQDYRQPSLVEMICPVIPSFAALSSLFECQNQRLTSDSNNLFGVGSRSAASRAPPMFRSQNSVNRFFEKGELSSPLKESINPSNKSPPNEGMARLRSTIALTPVVTKGFPSPPASPVPGSPSVSPHPFTPAKTPTFDAAAPSSSFASPSTPTWPTFDNRPSSRPPSPLPFPSSSTSSSLSKSSSHPQGFRSSPSSAASSPSLPLSRSSSPSLLSVPHKSQENPFHNYDQVLQDGADPFASGPLPSDFTKKAQPNNSDVVVGVSLDFFAGAAGQPTSQSQAHATAAMPKGTPPIAKSSKRRE